MESLTTGLKILIIAGRLKRRLGKEIPVLDLMRKHAQSWLIKVALGGIIVVFVLWYGWPTHREKSQDYAAKVNSTVITQQQFQTTYDAQLEQIRGRFKGAVPPELLEKMNVKKAVLDSLINQALLLEEAERLGLFATDEDLINDIKSNPIFQRDGHFDDQVYKFFVQHIKMTTAGYEALRKKELVEGQLVALLTDSVKTNPDEIKKYWHFQNDKLLLSVLLVPTVATQDAAKIEPQALEAFYKDNQHKYEIPVTLDLDFVAFSWRDMVKDVKVPEEDIKTYYQNNPKEFTAPESVKIRHIFVSVPENADQVKKDEALKKIEQIRQQAVSGADFAELAKKESDDKTTAEKGGELGSISKGSANPKIEAAAFKLEAGGISEPILLDGGYELIKVDEKKPETQTEYSEVHDKILQKLQEEKAKKLVATASEDFYEQVYRTENLNAPAQKFGFEIKKTSATKMAGIADLPPDPKLMDEAFSLKTGDISKMVRSGDFFVLMKLVQRNKERIPALEDIRSVVEKDFLKEQATKDTQSKATQIIDELKQPNADLDAVAKKHGLTWEELTPVARLANVIPKVGGGAAVSELLTTISSATPLYPTPVPAAGGSAIVRLIKLEESPEADYAKDAPAIEKWVLDVRKQEFLRGWLQLMKSKSNIDVRDKNL
jgi:peptidyl-prolyl cis-trans isomerase D